MSGPFICTGLTSNESTTDHHMRAVLIFSGTNAKPWLQVPLAAERASLGTDPSCDFVVNEPGIRPKHFEIERLGDQFRLRSRPDGTDVQVNGVQVHELWLHDGDSIQLGPSLQVQFRPEHPVGAPPSSPASASVPKELAGEDAGAPRAFQFLRDHCLFRTMGDESLNRIAESTRLVRVPAGETVVREGEPGQSFYLIESGSLEVLKNGALLRTLGRNNFFGEIALLKGGLRTATVMATIPSSLYELDRASFDQLLKSSPALVKHLVRVLASYGEERHAAMQTLQELRPAEPRIGLALSAGGAGGLVELGALKVLESEGIPIHMIAGCSTGAQIGAIYALNGSYEDTYKTVARFTRTQKQFRQQALDFSWLPWRGLVKGNRILKMFQEVTAGRDDFSKLKIPLRVVAAELETGREVIFKEGHVSLALRASSSVPGTFEPVKIAGRYLVDGGIVNPLPVNVLAEEGIDIIIAVLPRMVPGKGEVSRDGWSRNFLSVLTDSFSISVNQMRSLSACMADVAIAPEVGGIGLFDVHRLDELVALGEQAALQQIVHIRQLMQHPKRK